MIVVADASVALKWFFRARPAEQGVGPALALLRGVADGSVSLLQPPHFVAEVAAVLAREAPANALAWLADLMAIEMQVAASDAVYQRAVRLSSQLGHHLFDTLYHAVALETRDAVLLTADERYYRTASALGRIARLADFDSAGT